MAGLMKKITSPVFSYLDGLFGQKIQKDLNPTGTSSVDGIDRKPLFGVRLNELTGGDSLLAAAMQAVYADATSSRRNLIAEIERIKTFYLVQSLYNAVIEDSLVPDISTNEILQVVSQNTDINAELKTLQTLFNFDQIVNDIITEMLAYGEYNLRLVVQPGDGVIDIVDDVDPTRVVVFYSQGFPYYFLQQTDRDLEFFPPYLFANFIYGRQRLRLKLSNEYQRMGKYIDAYGQPAPSYCRIGRPLLYGVLSKMKELILLEQLIPSSQLNRIVTGSLITVNMPPSMEPKEVWEAARRYEDTLNSKIGVERSTGDISVTDILSTAGKLRVLPQFGDKGALTNINEIKENKTLDDLLHSVVDIRAVICGSLGFPPELFFGGREAGAKGEFLKRYGRYLRKLKDVQRAISGGVKQICMSHLINKGILARPEDIQVVFSNELINVDELEKLEFRDGLVSMISQIDQVVTALTQGVCQGCVDIAAYHRFLYQSAMALGEDANFITIPPGLSDKGSTHVDLAEDNDF